MKLKTPKFLKNTKIERRSMSFEWTGHLGCKNRDLKMEVSMKSKENTVPPGLRNITNIENKLLEIL